jgi:hypothetical protein
VATRANSSQSNLSGARNGGGSASNDLVMGLSNSNILAKEDANRFLTGLIVMLLVFALLLPLTVVMYIDVLAVRATVKEEVKQLRKLKKELETQKEN